MNSQSAGKVQKNDIEPKNEEAAVVKPVTGMFLFYNVCK